MALSANTALQMRNTRGMQLRSRTINTSSKIWKHAIVCLETATGNAALPAANSTTIRFFGIATEECLTGNGTRTVTVFDNVEVLMPLKTSVTKGMVNDAMYAADDATAGNLATLGPQMGTLTEFVAANSGWVLLRSTALSDAS